MNHRQLKHIEVKKAVSKLPIYVVCDDIRSPENAGMIFRISEAFGVQKIYFSANSPKSDNTRLKRSARSTQQIVEHEYSDDLKNVLITLKAEGFKLIGLEITNTSKALNETDFTKMEKIVLVVGAERTGISPDLLKITDETVHIPIFGQNSSMNVVNALAIALYEITKQKNDLG